LKTEIVFGPALLDRLEAFRGQRVGIITDAFIAGSGAVERIRAKLPDCDVVVYAEVVPEPSVADVVRGASAMAGFQPDLLVALGGGSSIDMAKAILATLRQVDDQRSVMLVAIPTTSGTGSEVTSYTVISDPERGLKFPLSSTAIQPDMALLDPELVMTVPPAVTADTGMDVITHGLEAYVSTDATDFTDAFAEKALDLAFANLPTAFADGSNLRAREAMHHASCMAGIAFNTAGLGLVHAMAHAIGGRFSISHGRINALLLPLVVDFNGDAGGANPPAAIRYAAIAHRLGLGSPSVAVGARNLSRALKRLNAQLGIPPTLRAFGLDMAEFSRCRQDLIDGALADSCLKSNPRQPRPQDVAQLLRMAGG
jgi:alcohol dehydrogenase class IV